ncbi:DUF1090 domain-containing protein [Scandinavium sp. H11S7]|uniref:DUF1090 domain-containing protein n=1 Tax=Scandinavium hiltneri TaxID=2926519 RepID=UPI002166131F|nr:DUF1090 domain-containing protein [Scandinavium hiltneri]MCS2158105.1 DUF1090 domain-containing protein [Scandinavium hiltneri]
MREVARGDLVEGQERGKKAQKVAGREQELTEAKATGHTDKIRKKQEKLDDAQDELADAKAELNK